MEKKQFLNQTDFINFYNDRFGEGYMDSWPQKKIRKITRILAKLYIPPGSRVLDFGCGTGIFTAILKKSFPFCIVYGCDISRAGIDKAKSRYPECTFLLNEELLNKNFNFSFNLIFTHHVLEHVDNLEEILEYFNKILSKGGFMLHILPCGNINSFESNICYSVKNGTDNKNGRFFFEDESHLRRLTSTQLIEIVSAFNIRFKHSWFANQYFGAIQWISETDYNFINYLTNPENAINENHRIQLLRKRRLLLFFHNAKKYNSVSLIELNRDNQYIRTILLQLKLMISYIIVNLLIFLANLEWSFFKFRNNGSEMYLLFVKE